jgi:hypothetical protein
MAKWWMLICYLGESDTAFKLLSGYSAAINPFKWGFIPELSRKSNSMCLSLMS